MSSSGHDDAMTTDAPSSAASTAAATASAAATPADDAAVNPDVASVEPGAMSAAGQHIANCYRSATTSVALFSLFIKHRRCVLDIRDAIRYNKLHLRVPKS